jgi:membrane protein YqaA with SNARE-associated domain
LTNWFQEFAIAYGPLGVFTVSLLGSVIPFTPIPYLFVVVLLSDVVEPWILGLAAGLGGSFGKITSYMLGRLGYRFLGQESRRRMDALRELIGKYGDVGVFIFALTPLPDDIYLIPAGMVRIPFWRFPTRQHTRQTNPLNLRRIPRQNLLRVLRPLPRGRAVGFNCCGGGGDDGCHGRAAESRLGARPQDNAGVRLARHTQQHPRPHLPKQK